MFGNVEAPLLSFEKPEIGARLRVSARASSRPVRRKGQVEFERVDPLFLRLRCDFSLRETDGVPDLLGRGVTIDFKFDQGF